ncbi:PepSY domain-containing protein [Bradyrhizobium oligotrophicum]|uniref:PepSY domain-containing protein n=1 Tax=Bradyrhizobium TaxID=374 RepID=UPI002916C6D9|nr:PepSY domain-containing protein [Bradyrhizobium sp. SZCCHNRI1073]
MLRWIHRVLAFAVVLPLMVLVLSGAVLSVIPAWERAEAISPDSISVADLAGRIANRYPGVEQIKRLTSGKVIAFYSGAAGPAASVVDPSSGKPVSDYVRSPFERWMTNLHRSFFLSDGGRMAAGASAFAMLVLTLSGLQMTARRMGGWRHILGCSRGGGMQRLHTDLGRLVAFGLVLSAMTALYLSLTTFGLIPDGTAQVSAFPSVTSRGQALPVEQIQALRGIDLSQLRELTFPNPANPNDLFQLATAAGEGYVDPVSGELLGWQDNSVTRQIYEFIYMLHTGQGLWWLGLLLGVSALGVPLLGLSGAVVWSSRKHAHAPITDNVPAQDADTVILVGSEGGSTWGFARTLHAALTANGHRIHVAPMDSLLRSYPSTQRMFLLTATYGDGAAPATAGAFLKRLDAISAPLPFPVAVLGFGDRQFPQFCQFARDVEAALARKGSRSLMPLDTIDRQSGQEFARWGEALSDVMGEDLVLIHVPERPRTHTLTLIERVDYGAEVQAPTCVLRFALPRSGMFARLTGHAWPRFAAGDLIAILPPDCNLPRYYSLASSTRDGFVEICVRKRPGGLCSGLLHGLQPGDRVEAFLKANPAFRPSHGRKPVILIGAGTGIGPLAGFVRANGGRRPMHLYFGGRDPASDFLYEREIDGWLGEKRLTSLTTAFSRVKGGGYVQDRLRDDADRLRALVANGAQVMVCGGRDMAADVMQAVADVLAPLGLDPVALKAQGRYVEDVY